ncbi:MAG: M28 family peptidase, partial [Rubrivivax sp.]
MSAVALDPDIVVALNQVSTSRIEARIRTLAAFGTRHTLSDVVSPTQGIGAARRWIQHELQGCSQASGGRLQVTLDEHVAPAGPRLPRAVNIVNVVATLPGTDAVAAARHLVVSGHYDSRAGDIGDTTSPAPGANDDASGVAAVMEMACVMAGHRFESTLVFMAVAGEEQGLIGAEHWARQARAKGLHIDAMITNDIIGSPVGDDGKRRADTVRLFADGLSPLLR